MRIVIWLVLKGYTMGLEARRPHNMSEPRSEIPQINPREKGFSSLLRRTFSRSPLSQFESHNDDGRITEAKKELNKLTLAPAGVPTESLDSVNDYADKKAEKPGIFKINMVQAFRRVFSPRQGVIPIPGEVAPPQPDFIDKATELLKKLARSKLVRTLMVIATLGGSGTAAYKTFPAFENAVNSGARAIGFNVGETPVPSTFDNSLDEGVFGKNNLISLPLDKIQEKYPTPIAETQNSLTVLSPFQLPEASSATFSRSLSEFLPTKELHEQAQRDGIKDMVKIGLPKGTKIKASADVFGFIDMGKEKFGQDPNKSLGVFWVYYDKESDITYKMKIFSSSNDSQIHYFEPQVPNLQLPPDYPIDRLRGTDWQNWPQIQQGTTLVILSEDEEVTFAIEKYRGKKIGPEAALIDKTLSVVTPNFFTETNKMVEMEG